MFIDRRRDRPVRHLKWRVGLTGAAAAVALVGIFLDHRLLVWVAIVLLAVAFSLRLVPAHGEESELREDDEDTQ